jgi:hypothetical protein
VELQGFVTQRRSGLTLTVGQEATIDKTLAIATIEESVTVAGESPLVATTTNALETAVTQGRLDTLPLPSRNFQVLANLSPDMLGVGSGGRWGRSFRSSVSAPRPNRQNARVVHLFESEEELCGL